MNQSSLVKVISLCVLLLGISHFCIGQSFSFKVTGSISEPGDNQYAYLIIKPPADARVKPTVIRSKIDNHQFSFSGSVERYGHLVRYADLIFSADTVTPQNKGSFAHRPISRMFPLEDCEIETLSPDAELKIKGTALNDQWHAYLGNDNIEAFATKFPDSPINLLLLGVYASLPERSPLRVRYDIRTLFLNLSADLQTSAEGKKIADKLFKQ